MVWYARGNKSGLTAWAVIHAGVSHTRALRRHDPSLDSTLSCTTLYSAITTRRYPFWTTCCNLLIGQCFCTLSSADSIVILPNQTGFNCNYSRYCTVQLAFQRGTVGLYVCVYTHGILYVRGYDRLARHCGEGVCQLKSKCYSY